MINAYTVRLATPEDAETLSTIATRTFRTLATTTLKGDITPEDLAVHLANAYKVEKMRAEIEDPNGVTVFVFPKEDQVNPCGFVMLLDGSIRPGDEGVAKAEDHLEVKRVYVDTAFHGKGAAHVMMARVMEIIKQKNRKVVWIGTGPRNIQAQTFYRKYGFEITGPRYFQVGSVAHKDIVLTLRQQGQELPVHAKSTGSLDERVPQAVSS